MSSQDIDEYDHHSHMERAFALAREAAARGDDPFGSVLVRDDEIIMESSNRVVTEDDLRRHPELHLAYRAMRELSPEERSETVMYTSTEPCPMCASGMRRAELARVVYSTSATDLEELRGSSSPVRATRILEDVTDVVGDVRNGDGRHMLDECLPER
ncbi:nucleoside deaminase [Salinigranum marinum]|uniref:nucleoside deaminase n=1 Tax=Salinigranum marinum TaxID=1515595 RepID=UPI002989B890|nr:nucleoside deaminase [Salinigranum marinum]